MKIFFVILIIGICSFIFVRQVIGLIRDIKNRKNKSSLSDKKDNVNDLNNDRGVN